MSIPVAVADVERRVREFGERATLITVGDDGRPHAVSVLVRVDAERLGTTVGGRTAANARARPGVAFVWDPTPGGDYQLIVDGSVERVVEATGSTSVVVAVERGILHRIAAATGTGPSCITLDG